MDASFSLGELVSAGNERGALSRESDRAERSSVHEWRYRYGNPLYSWCTRIWKSCRNDSQVLDNGCYVVGAAGIACWFDCAGCGTKAAIRIRVCLISGCHIERYVTEPFHSLL